jgi:ribosomal protein S18 acetylase RimI-like enzyme
MGIATEMLEYATTDLKKRGVEVVYIDTGSNNAKARHLYEKMGFREFRRTLHFKKALI